MKKSVIVVSDEISEVSPELLTILRESGLVARAHGPAAEVTRDHQESSLQLIALIYQLPFNPAISRLHKVVQELRSDWPRLPLIACAHADVDQPQGLREIIRQVGFDAVADSAAQLPALLREVENHQHADEPAQFKAAPEQFAFRLTESMPKPQLRAAFALVSSLHGATNQTEAASFAISGLGRLIKADRWTIFVSGDSAAPAIRLASLATRTFDGQDELSFDHHWHQELLESCASSEQLASSAALEAAATAGIVHRFEDRKHVLAAPLVSGERVIGAAEGIRGEAAGSFSAGDLRLLEAVAPSIAFSLSNSVRIADAERLSLTDELTRLHNARYLRAFLVNEIKRARRYRTKVAALFLDLDDFKQVNDLHGHLAGSHCLMEVAALLLPSVRDTDCVVRYGGDEFVVILPEAGLEDAAIVAERIRAKIETHRFTGGRRLMISFTVSLGVAVFPDNALSPQQLISCADQAMYAAKAANKNCVRLAATSITNMSPNNQETSPPRNQLARIPGEKFIS